MSRSRLTQEIVTLVLLIGLSGCRLGTGCLKKILKLRCLLIKKGKVGNYRRSKGSLV